MVTRIAIGGSRYYTDYERFAAIVDQDLAELGLEEEVILLSGHARGVDTMVERYAQEHGLRVEIFQADWSLGRVGGPLRNQRMVAAADYVIAFPGGGPGTRSLISLSRKKGILLRIHDVSEAEGVGRP